MKTKDSCTSFNLNQVSIIGKLVRLDNTINTILGRHCYPRDVSGVLAESIALAALLSSSIKYEGLFTLQTQTDGAVPMVVVDASSQGVIRACARFDEDRINKLRNPNDKYKLEDGEMLETPHWLGKGYLAFTVDQGEHTNLYQGVVELEGKTLSECAIKYFKQSEQLETWLHLYLQAPETKDGKWKSAGIMLQKLPDNETDFEQAAVLAQTLKKEEVFDDNLSDKQLLHRLFHNNDLKISGEKDYRFGCRCSREKLLDNLKNMSDEEIESMCEKNKIVASCSFCSEQYSFEKGELIKQ